VSTASDAPPNPPLAGRGSEAEPRVMLRLLGFARPYLWLVLVAVLLEVGFSAGRYARVYLLKPAFDDVIAPSLSLQQQTGSLPFGLSELAGEFGLGAAAVPPDAAPAPDEGAGPARDAAAPEGGAAVAESGELPAAERARIEREILDNLRNVILAAAIIILAMPLVMFGREYVIQWVLGRIDVDMKVRLCGKLLELPLRFHQDRQRGDVLARATGDAGVAHGALTLLFSDFLEAAIMLVAGVAAMIYVSWKLSLVLLVVGPGIFGVISVFGRRINKSARSRQRRFADVTQRLLEVLAGIKTIKAFRAERYEHEAFGRASEKLFRRGMRVVVNRVLARTLIDTVNNTAAITVIVVGIFLVLGGWGLSMGDLAAFTGISVTSYRPVRSLAKGWVRLVDAQPSAERFFEVFDSPMEIRDASDAVAIPRLRDHVRFDHVSFSYGREPVLRDVSFTVRAGEVAAIVGPTGAGKTTLIDLLLRFYDPTEGRIEIDGVDLRRIRRDELLDQMAVVTQDPFLFDGTIRENILYGRPGAGNDEVIAAARAAHVEEFASELPDGYETVVGAAGTRLSGGQRQRITIARAVLRDPAILIFDEATSSLDSRSERYVQDAIEKLMPGRTVFVIAHRLSTVRRADQILVLDAGRIRETGSHDELVARRGLYRELVDLQNSRLIEDADPEGEPRTSS